MQFGDIVRYVSKMRNRSGILASQAMEFVGLMYAVLTIMVVSFVGTTLATQLNNANTTLIWNNATAGVVNFTAQLGTVGTNYLYSTYRWV